MRVKAVLFLLFAAIIFFTASCQALPAGSQGSSAGKKPAVGRKAEDFTLKDLQGNRISLSDFRDKEAVVLIFSATWCYYCTKEIPNLERIHQKYGDKGIKVLAVYIKESKNKVLSLVGKKDISYTILLDADGKAASSYNVRGIPAMFVIDKKGEICYTGRHPSDSFLEEIAK